MGSSDSVSPGGSGVGVAGDRNWALTLASENPFLENSREKDSDISREGRRNDNLGGKYHAGGGSEIVNSGDPKGLGLTLLQGQMRSCAHGSPQVGYLLPTQSWDF